MTTKEDIQQTINRINRKLSLSGDDAWVIEYAYGMPMVLDKRRDISPRLPRRELALWLSGFEECLDFELVASVNRKYSSEQS